MSIATLKTTAPALDLQPLAKPVTGECRACGGAGFTRSYVNSDPDEAGEKIPCDCNPPARVVRAATPDAGRYMTWQELQAAGLVDAR